MSPVEKFFEFLELYRHRFNLTTHMHSDFKETSIEIMSNKVIVIRDHDPDYDNCYAKALEDLIEWVGFKIASMEEVC